jgi:D-glycero-D-manno-heptose 1,7-bisphosphate phosphatase
MSARPAVFLDRDGTMVHDVGYLSRREDLRWYPYTVDAIRLLNRAGFLVFVTTNQGGIALGFATEAFVEETHAEMAAFVAAAGGRIDGFFFCPHHPLSREERLRVSCECRKPQPGMIRQAQQRFEIDLARSFVVGDKIADVGLATGVGARGILVQTGYGAAEVQRHAGQVPGAACVAAELMDATVWILTQAGHPREAT